MSSFAGWRWKKELSRIRIPVCLCFLYPIAVRIGRERKDRTPFVAALLCVPFLPPLVSLRLRLSFGDFCALSSLLIPRRLSTLWSSLLYRVTPSREAYARCVATERNKNKAVKKKNKSSEDKIYKRKQTVRFEQQQRNAIRSSGRPDGGSNKIKSRRRCTTRKRKKRSESSEKAESGQSFFFSLKKKKRGRQRRPHTREKEKRKR